MQKDDLLRLMRDPNLLPSEKQVLLSDIASQAAAMDLPCYIVGGFVRDLLLREPVNDLDIIVEGDAIRFGESLVKKFGGKLTLHDKFHTAIWHLPNSSDTLDLITARKETYERPGALPTVIPSTIDDDLHRRDFTINSMAIRIDGDHFGELLDPLSGQADLEDGLIRVLHPRSFVDDPTRIFRAIRYEARYSFNLEPLTLNLVNPEALDVIPKLSGERIRHELDLIFEEKDSSQMILRLGEFGVFKKIHPKLPLFNADYSDFLEMDPTLDIPASRTVVAYMLWLMDLSESEILSIGQRLYFTTDQTYSIWAVSQLKKSLPFLTGSSPSVWTYALEKLPLLSIYVVYLVTREDALLDFLSIWRHVKPHTTGDDLKARGLEPGPRFGEILHQIRAAWLDGEVSNKEEENDFLNSILNGHSSR
ncbi:MAG: CCA tRNA nucleotidyltransferase [Anaerolineales bacterium]|nr:CCA tRNA nucleotidyltransferase [Anaerolineales bacterium]